KIVTVAKMAYAPAERLLPRHADILERIIIPFSRFPRGATFGNCARPKDHQPERKARSLEGVPLPGSAHFPVFLALIRRDQLADPHIGCPDRPSHRPAPQESLHDGECLGVLRCFST